MQKYRQTDSMLTIGEKKLRAKHKQIIVNIHTKLPVMLNSQEAPSPFSD